MYPTFDSTRQIYFAQVKNFLQLEAEAIAKVAQHLQPERVEQAFSLLLACQGKVGFLFVTHLKWLPRYWHDD